VQKPLKNILKRKAGLVLGQFKSLLASMVGTLMRALDSEYGVGIPSHLVRGEIRDVGAARSASAALEVKAFPLEAIVGSTKLVDALITSLKKNDALGATRLKAGIDDEEWSQALSAYGKDVVRMTIPLAIKKLMQSRTPMYGNMVVIDLADSVPMKVRGTPGFHKLVVLFSAPFLDRERTKAVKRAARIWRQRNNGSYECVFGDYDGFVAP